MLCAGGWGRIQRSQQEIVTESCCARSGQSVIEPAKSVNRRPKFWRPHVVPHAALSPAPECRDRLNPSPSDRLIRLFVRAFLLNLHRHGPDSGESGSERQRESRVRSLLPERQSALAIDANLFVGAGEREHQHTSDVVRRRQRRRVARHAATGTPPGEPEHQPADVGRVDLIQRRITLIEQIAAIDGPVGAAGIAGWRCGLANRHG